MRYAVIGSGMMGSAAAYDLAKHNENDEITLADADLSRAQQAAARIGPNVRPLHLDVNNDRDVAAALHGCAAVISAVSYSVNYRLTLAAIEAGVNMCDLGGNNEVVQKQLSLDSSARERGVTIVPNCGLAPGLLNILTMAGVKEFDSLDTIRVRVGGLPLHPQPPLYYQIVFSVDGLINEYIEKVEAIRDGKLVWLDPMTDLEDITFPEPFGELEAFNTSGGLSTLARLLQGKVHNLDYKTIRYKGHCERFKTLLDLGFASNEPIVGGGSVKTSREFFTELLRKKLDYGGKDVVLARTTITGHRGDTPAGLAYELIDYYDDATGITAMMRTTAFPTSIIATLLAHGAIRERGVRLPEVCIPGRLMIEELGRRNIRITKSVTQPRR